MNRELDSDLEMALAERLLECKMATQSLDSIIEKLPPEIQNRRKKTGILNTDINELISCCNYYEATDILIHRIYCFEKNSRPMKRVFEFLPKFFKLPNVIKHEFIAELFKLLMELELERELWIKCYYQSIPDGLSPHGEPENLISVVVCLCNMQKNSQPDPMPLLRFVDKLSAHKGEGFKNLKQWKAKVEKNTPIQLEIRETLPQPSHLMIIVKEHPENRNQRNKRYVVQWALGSKDKLLPTQKNQSCEVTRLKDIAKEVFAKPIGLDGDLWVEYFLPERLIVDPIDQSEYKQRILKTIGKEYKVVIRFLTRWKPATLDDETCKHAWKIKWNIFQKSCNHSQNIFGQSDTNTYSLKELCDLKKNNQYTALIMRFIPQYKKITVGDIIFESGMPIALISRNKGVAPDPIREDLLNLIKGNDLNELPERVLKKRMEAENPEDLGNHLTLIWDDPGRVPHFNY